MVTIKTKFSRGKESVTIEKKENVTLKEVITTINVLDVQDVVNAVGKVSWGYRNPESLSYFWEKLW